MISSVLKSPSHSVGSSVRCSIATPCSATENAAAILSDAACQQGSSHDLKSPPLRAFAAALLKGQALRSWYTLLFQLPKLPEWLLTVRNGWGIRKI